MAIQTASFQIEPSILEDVVSRLLQAGNPEKIILFGSQARGDATPESDLDLLIVDDSGLPKYDNTVRYLKALKKLGYPKDVLVCTPQDYEAWSDTINHIYAVARREGKVLYEKKPHQQDNTGNGRRHNGEMKKKTDADHATELLKKAEKDIVMINLAMDNEGPYDPACFHAQQAIEKMIKAVIAFHGIEYPKIHNIDKLQALCIKKIPDFPIHDFDFEELSPFAIDSRYSEETDPVMESAQSAQETVRQIHNLVYEYLPDHVLPKTQK